MNWLEVAVLADEEAVEAVAELLRPLGQGVAIEVPFVQPTPEHDARQDFARPAIVKTYVPDEGQEAQLRGEIEQALWHLGRLRPVEPPQVRRISQDDWANSWKAFFPVVRVGRRTVIVPAWRRHRRQPGEIIVRLDPGLAFGTGTHPTTRLCLEALEQQMAPLNHPFALSDGEEVVRAPDAEPRGGEPFGAAKGFSVLDAGTGSGVLAIAAARLGASHVVALDVDPIAVTAARSNVRLNRLSRRISVRLRSPEQPGRWRRHGPFDLVLANISARENARMAPTLASLLATGGRLVASGILTQDAAMVAEPLIRSGLTILERPEAEDWTALVAGWLSS